ncbi:MAG: peptidase [Candidatus Muproteobacteria bacterium RBG_16_64_11]|uniref:Peptidase n=1 Tax=Candidatus Muproteobacteria bacterium RBG_16_64_11 TaxID=1817758 RepID=A0A1F6TDT1_9PROT|nr:MAG: peptidase [Candidatus Muproteobacteria bacterium RBG_16_64_11]
MKPARRRVVVHVPNQTLTLFDSDGRALMETRVATARNGVGEQSGSECTPCGRHIVRAKIGVGQPLNAVFVSRRPTGEIYTPALRAAQPDRDWILTRILWLSGIEPGRNRLGEVDTMRRFIYIHGCPDDDPMGVPSSRGCVKMRNRDIVALFDQVEPGTPVDIVGAG